MTVLEATGVKVCNVCEEGKPFDAFYKRSASVDGLQAKCKLCCREYNNKTWRKYHDPAKAKIRTALYHARHPEKVAAEHRLRQAVYTGRVAKATACEVCQEVLPANEIDGHHQDYSKPFDVEWLCRGCHMKRHQKEFV